MQADGWLGVVTGVEGLLLRQFMQMGFVGCFILLFLPTTILLLLPSYGGALRIP